MNECEYLQSVFNFQNRKVKIVITIIYLFENSIFFKCNLKEGISIYYLQKGQNVGVSFLLSCDEHQIKFYLSFTKKQNREKIKLKTTEIVVCCCFNSSKDHPRNIFREKTEKKSKTIINIQSVQTSKNLQGTDFS